ncbi:MAG: DUF917 domain-containing protein [Clostridia bacterium]|nr:DUF917 domain-containing protein [Clostridia bacterium]
MKYINYDWIKPLYYGSTFLGVGGGGKTNNILLLCEETFSKGLRLPLLETKSLNSEENYAAVGLIGSPEVIDDFYCTGHEALEALKALELETGSKIQGLFTLEGAGVNVLYPILVASILQIPFIDGDTMGRAFPELQMTTLHLNKQPLIPFILANTSQKIYHYSDLDNFLLDLNIRQDLSDFNNIGFFASSPLKGGPLKRMLIPHTISFAYDIGNVFMGFSTYEDILNNLIHTTKNSIYGASIELFSGKIEKVDHVIHKDWHSIHLKGIKHNKGESFQILTQNENLIAYKNNALAAMVPDLISLINLDTLLPISNNDLSTGMQVAVIGTPAPLVWKTSDGLNIVGPKCFGYKSEYESLEALYFSYYY